MKVLKALIRIGFMGVSVALLGCASGYAEFYTPNQDVTEEAIATYRVAAPATQPVIERAAPPGRDATVFLTPYLRRGFFLIGSARFSSGSAPADESALAQARKVGADLVVIFEPRYIGSSTTAIPITTPTTTTSYSSGTATAFGPRGVVSAYGTGATTTYGTATTMIPITQHRSDYGAAYFVKRKVGLGTIYRDLNDAERHYLQSNKGVSVDLIIDNSPAFAADLLTGDIILAIDGESVVNSQGFSEQLMARNGKQVALSIIRGGERSEKVIQLQPI